MQLFTKLQSHLAEIQDKLLEGPIKQELHHMFSQLSSVLKTHLDSSLLGGSKGGVSAGGTEGVGADGGSTDIQSFMTLQIGFETMRLWRQLCPPHAITKGIHLRTTHKSLMNMFTNTIMLFMCMLYIDLAHMVDEFALLLQVAIEKVCHTSPPMYILLL